MNDNKAPELLTTGSSLAVNWRCLEGHEYEAKIANRTILGRNCPYCAGRYALTGVNDIATTNPEVMKYWDYEMNTLKPEEVKKSTHKEFHWICEQRHQWLAMPYYLTDRHQFCPFCSGKRVIPGETDFATVYSEKLKFWNYEKNIILPTEVSARNTMIVNWKCQAGHEWTGKVDSLTGCAKCLGRKGLKGFHGLDVLYPHLLLEWDYEKNDKEPSKYSYGSSQRVWWKCEKGHSWDAPVCKRTGKNVTNCPTCALTYSTSKAEGDICKYLESVGLEVETSNRTILEQGQELDIYIASKNVAIEYNGIYWHSEAFRKDRKYHHDKWLACKDKGIQLIQIWEDEWNRNPEQIKRMLAHKLGISNERKVFARKTTVVELDKAQTELFLNENHVQGYASGSYYLGLKDKSDDEIVSVLVLKKEAGTEGKTLNIIRYATNANVVGGFTKLLKHAAKQYQPESFLTFSDNCVSDGGLYENNGFIADKELPPDYMYVVGNIRRHKFGYRISKFKSDPKLLWEEGLTERQLAELNGLKRIWDAGKTRWVLKVCQDNP